MATYGGFNFTNFRGVNLRNTAAIRMEGDGSFVGTFSVRPSLGADREWILPDKSGAFGITSTVVVNLPAVSAGDILGTNVVITGVRTEDGIVASIMNMTTTGIGTRGFVFLGGVQAGNGNALFTFVNPTATATVYKDVSIAYTLVR